LDLTEQLQLDNLKSGQLLVSVIAAVLLNVTSHALDIILTSSTFHSILLVVPISIAVYLTIDVAQALLKIALPPIYTRRLRISIPLPLPLLACFAIRTLTLGSSSFIEYEYKTWYYQNAKLNYMRVAREISSLLSESLVKFDYGFIALGLTLTTAVSLSISFKVFVIL